MRECFIPGLPDPRRAVYWQDLGGEEPLNQHFIQIDLWVQVFRDLCLDPEAVASPTSSVKLSTEPMALHRRGRDLPPHGLASTWPCHLPRPPPLSFLTPQVLDAYTILCRNFPLRVVSVGLISVTDHGKPVPTDLSE